MLAQSGGRLLPLAPASAAASVAMLAAGFGPATGAAVPAATVAAFMIGMSLLLTLAGAVLGDRRDLPGRRPGRAGRRLAGRPPAARRDAPAAGLSRGLRSTAPQGAVRRTRGLGPTPLCRRVAGRRFLLCPRSPITAPAPGGVLRLPRLSRGGAQVALFFLAYLVYSGARYFTIGDLGDATANAHWIVGLEDDLGLGIEGAVQTALTGSVALWILNHVYLAAQLVVLPGALWLLHRKARPAYIQPAQHGARHLAAVDPRLRPVPGRPAAARRRRPGRHDLQPDRLRDGLQPDHLLLQRARRGARACTSASRSRSASPSPPPPPTAR